MKSVFINKPFNVGGRVVPVGLVELSDVDIERAERFGVVGKKIETHRDEPPANRAKKVPRKK